MIVMAKMKLFKTLYLANCKILNSNAAGGQFTRSIIYLHLRRQATPFRAFSLFPRPTGLVVYIFFVHKIHSDIWKTKRILEN